MQASLHGKNKTQTDNMGNRAKVMDRWYGREKGFGWREPKKPREPFRGKPQFTFEDLYITPFTHERTTDQYGNVVYYPLTERNMTPSGVAVMDDYLQHLFAGKADIADFCARYNARTADLDSLVFLLTGMPNLEFRTRWQLTTADALLRYTKMAVADIAVRSGMGTRNNMYFIYEREFDQSPTERRDAIRQDGDLGRFAIR